MARFLTLADVAEELNTTTAQVYALVRSGELPAVKIGGRGQWRVERDRLEEWITARYAETAAFVSTHPFPLSLAPPPDGAAGEGPDAHATVEPAPLPDGAS